MKPRFAQPHSALAGLVSCYWGWEVSSEQARGFGILPNVFPSVENEIHISYGDPIRIGLLNEPGEKWITTQGHIIGNHLSPFRIEATGSVGFFNVRLLPGAFYRLFGVSAYEADSPVTDLRITGKRTEYYDFIDKIRDARSFETRIALSDRYFSKLLNSNVKNSPFVDEALIRITRSKGRIRISELAKNLGVVKKTLERKFLERIGRNPKEFARLVRFQNAAWMKLETGNLSDLSLDAGFYDQPHLTREFASLAGYSPLVWYRKRDSILSLFYNTRPDSF
ncbi:helix-turn-helix domain-containing protein [Leptospira yasudae]|uniref:AraC family transcriptional regulator n=1 Tax=Leptospira yasudae TaxID=2202201 RepID=A0A6N4QHN7_9LEPT|nr:helix-turn-helix domain-containing protein [Leptospira yasudae]TGL77093.1 AraC family transcriptional regulator [Leptospira yasudae]TGL78676.1 AraC family transcriptional regulator [Leptospira yasudae]TGL80392.1 AraC family transcriptional regulator [Leptospira yasudae]